ncbi:GNAT family N-acetyltransferase [bacterium]|nr:GNAT family N-acetyltransferase [bacterium]
MLEYRTFRNGDPPEILEVWKASRDSRAFAVVRTCDALETLLFAKPYFDPNGFIIAESDGRIVGFAHAGFGATEDKQGIDHSLGAVYIVRVHPAFRNQGIGANLLKLAQSYLARHGAIVQYLGGMFPLNAFYVGLYGGSELPGLLESDASARRFASAHGYEPFDKCLVYQRKVEDLPRVADTRIALLRRSVEVQAEPWPLPTTWWDAAVLGNMPSLRYEMIERETQTPIGRAWVWEMEYFGQAWGFPTVGITDFQIDPSFRRRGYGKLLLLTMLKHLKEQQIELVELQTMSTNDSAQGLYEGLGFMKVDSGQAFRLSRPLDLTNLPPLKESYPTKLPQSHHGFHRAGAVIPITLNEPTSIKIERPE